MDKNTHFTAISKMNWLGNRWIGWRCKVVVFRCQINSSDVGRISVYGLGLCPLPISFGPYCIYRSRKRTFCPKYQNANDAIRKSDRVRRISSGCCLSLRKRAPDIYAKHPLVLNEYDNAGMTCCFDAWFRYYGPDAVSWPNIEKNLPIQR